jgi:hypothetical protein
MPARAYSQYTYKQHIMTVATKNFHSTAGFILAKLELYNSGLADKRCDTLHNIHRIEKIYLTF